MRLRVQLRVKKMGPIEVPLPAYQTEGAAGLDLCAALAESLTLMPGGRRLVATGIALEIPVGFEGQVRPRSGLALRHGVGIVNSPGTVDSDYRGEIGVVLINHGQEPFVVKPGDRIAQLVVTPVARAVIELVENLSETERGGAGYGSTGQ
jgi:dUTP pyrophosphatase